MKEGIILSINQINTVIMTNEGEFLSVPTKPSWQVGEKVSVTDFEIKHNDKTKQVTKRNKSFWQKKVLIAIVASLLLFMVPLANITEASTTVTLDINPSIELEVKNDKVIKTTALNDDGKYLISKIKSSDLNGDLYTVTSNIINQAEQLGYLKIDEENFIMIGLTKNTDFEVSTYEEYILNELTEKNIEAEILVLSGSKDEKKIADNNGLSLGKYLMQTKQKNNEIISDEQITKEDIKQFMKNVKEEEKNKQSKENSNNKSNSNKNENNSKDVYVISNTDKIKHENNNQEKNKDKENKSNKEDKDSGNSNKENNGANKEESKTINQKQQSGNSKDEGSNRNQNNSSKQENSSKQGNNQTNSANNKK